MTDAWQPVCSMEALEARAAMLSSIRAFFQARQVLEVQTSVVGSHTVTDANIESFAVPSLGYLQTSPEYQMKRLLAAGAPSIYQIASAFRAGEKGRLHNPEFMLLEWYRVGFDDQALMMEVAELVNMVLGEADYRHIPYADLVGDLSRPGHELDLALAEAVESLGTGRFFITRYPADQAALARLCDDDPAVAARFELVVDGVELANGYHELSDPQEQRRRFAGDLEIRSRRGAVEPTVDEKFLAALEAGLPDCAGVALGLDRLLMLSLGASSLAEVMPFPVGVA